MKEQLQLLVELQDVDIKIGQLREKIAKGPAKIEKIQAELSAFEEKVNEEAVKLDELEKQRRGLELELKEGEERVQKSKENLMHIKSNKEYKAVLKEIGTLEKANHEIETRVLLCMDDSEKANAVFAEKKRDVSERKADAETQKKQVEEEIRTYEQELASVRGLREQLVGRIDEKVFKKYEEVRQCVGIVGVARVENAVCHGCHMNIPAQMYNELQKFDSIRLCPHCQRIMIYDKKEEGLSEQPK